MNTYRACALTALIASGQPVLAEVDYSIQSKSADRSVIERYQDFTLHSNAQLKLAVTPDAGNGEWAAETNTVQSFNPGEVPLPKVRSGFWYFAGLEFERYQGPSGLERSSEFVSSRQLGVHYGRLGSISYSGIDFGFERQSGPMADRVGDDKELWSLGVTTGKRFAATGLDSTDPVWTLSVRGQFNFEDSEREELMLDNQSWYVSPGLHWERESFQLSADLLMPFIQTGEFGDESDYSVRARIIKKF
jgi:hypothetical protein